MNPIEIINSNGFPIVIFLFLISAGIVIYSGIQASITAFVLKGDPLYSSFALCCLGASGYQIASTTYYLAGTIDTAGSALRWQLGFIFIMLPALVAFVSHYTGLKQYKKKVIVVTLIFVIFQIANFISPYSLRFATLIALPPLVLPWGESLMQFTGLAGWWVMPARLIITSIILWSLWRSIIQYRRGERRAALLLAISMLIILASMIWGKLIDMGVLDSFYTGVFAFLGLVMLMNLSMSMELRNKVIALNEETEKRTEAEAKTDYFTKFFSIFDSLAEGVVTADMHGNIVNINQAACRMFGYSAHELIGQNVTILMPDEYAEQHDRNITNYETSHEITIVGKERELQGESKDGRVFPITITLSTFNWHDSQHIVASISDISEHKKQQIILKQAKEVADKANKAKSSFISSMSHELRTPLNAVIGFSQLLQIDKDISKNTKESVNEIYNAGHHLLNLINDILDLSRIESGVIDVHTEIVDVAEILNSSLQISNVLALHNDITLSTEKIEPLKYYVYADKIRLKQILLNLLSNAIKYNRQNGTVTLSINSNNVDNLTIKITDTGRGLSEEELSLLFEPFNRLGAEKSNIEGTGIGLTITKQLIELMNGTISVQSVKGEGSTFIISLPVAEKPSINESNELKNNSLNNERTRKNQLKVLYVEDSVLNQQVLQAMLATRSDIELRVTESAENALDLIKEDRPDIILSDIYMPGMNGYEFVEHLQSIDDYKSIPVIAVSANVMVEDLEKAKKYGFVDYIAKPIIIDDLFKSIDKNT